MVGVHASVWVRAGLLPHIRGVQATSVGTGIMGYLGNKGALSGLAGTLTHNARKPRPHWTSLERLPSLML